MKKTTLLLLFLTTCIYSQWVLDGIIPNDSGYSLNMNQICVIDSSFSWAQGIAYRNQNIFSPFFAKRNSSGWRYIETDLNPEINAYCFTAIDSLRVWLGAFHPSEIYYSSNGGINWILQYHVADTGHVTAIMFSKQNNQIGYAFATLALNTFWNGVSILKTTNGGVNWQKWDFEYYGFLCADNSISVVDSNYAWFGVDNVTFGTKKIIMTSNGGVNWVITDVETGMGGPFTIQFSSDKQTGLFVGQTNPVSRFYRTTNAGLNWNIVYTVNYYYSETMRWVQGTSNVYGNSEFVIVRSVDNGLTWRTMSGLPSTEWKSIDAVRLSLERIFALAVSNDRQVYKFLDTVKVIGIENPGTFVPKEFKVYQNYPNPFNPVTTIKYDTPKDAFITIKIYDILGREVFSINEFKKAGQYEVKFDGSNFASGIYFYSLESNGFKDTKKMVLIK